MRHFAHVDEDGFVVQVASFSWCESELPKAADGCELVELERQLPPSPGGRGLSYHLASRRWIDRRNFERLLAHKRIELNEAKAAEIEGGFVWDGSRFQADQLSQTRLLTAVLSARDSALNGEAFSRTWRLFDNTTRVMSCNEMIAAGMAMDAFNNQIVQKQIAVDEALSRAANNNDLESIEWPV